MLESGHSGQLTELNNGSFSHPYLVSSFSTLLTINNDGADEKSEIVISISDSEGNYKQYLVTDKLVIGDVYKCDLSSLNIKIVRIRLRSRGSDGIARYIMPLEAKPGLFFSILHCGWIASPNDHTVEEHFFYGEERRI